MKTSKKALVTVLCLFMGVWGLSVLLITAPVFAVNQDEFELDGNVVQNHPTPPIVYDWVNMFNVTNGVATPKPLAQLPTHFGPAAFTRDFKLKANGNFDSSDDTTFTTGSKDTLNIGAFGGQPAGWQCANSNNVQNQVDLMNVYAVAYIDTSVTPNHLIIYFGAERNGNNGTKNIGIWFLQDKNVGCSSPGGAVDFTGNHTDGDIFIVSEFSNGGSVSTINVYEWVGGPLGALNPTPIATGADCSVAPAGDVVCAVTNTLTFTPPWLTQTDISGSAQSTSVQQFEFFEGGLDLTATGLNACFSTVVFTTRSSDSLTATIFDFAIAQFPLCGLNATKSCAGNGVINPGGTSIHYTFNGTVTNTGFGTLSDVTLVDTLPANTIANTVVFKNGTPAVPPSQPGPANTTVSTSPCPAGSPQGAVCANLGSLGGQAVENWSVEFDSTSLSPQNNVYATSAEVTSDPKSASCSTTPVNTIQITKNCGVPIGYPGNPNLPGAVALPGTVLVDVGSTVAVQVNFSGIISNTGASQLTGITLTDNPAATITVAWPGATGVLAPNATANYSGYYLPSALPLTDPLGLIAGRYGFSDESLVTGATATLGSSPGFPAPCQNFGTSNVQACAGTTCNICPATPAGLCSGN